MHKLKLYIGGGLLFLTLLSGAILSAPHASADTSGTVDITVSINAACTLTPANTNLTQTIAPGTTGNIGTANLKAVCNDAGGFAIYAIGYTNNTNGNTDLVAELGTEHSIHTGTGTSASNWNMTIDNATTTGNYDATIENDFDEASAVPETYTKIATVTSTTDQSIGTNLTADFNAYIAPNQVASTYEGKVKFTLVHPSAHAAPETAEGFDLAFEKAGKSKIFNDDSNGHYSMSDITPAICAAVDVNDEGKLIDPRDNTVYSVARLADGNCWMTQNLRFDFSKDGDKITATNTNNPTATFLAAANAKPTSSSSWCTSFATACIDQLLYNTVNIGNTTEDPDGHTYDEYGVYYNWYTAMAGNSTGDSVTVSGDICPKGWHLPTTTTRDGAPSTWTGEYWDLAVSLAGLTPGEVKNDDLESIISAENSARFKASPNNFLYSVGYNTGSNLGNYGGYWSSTASSYAYAMCLRTDRVDAGVDTSLYYGYAVRCLAN